MLLPNSQKAVVDIAKLRDYCLDMSHPRGRHKARVFAASLGIFPANAEKLREALLNAAQTVEATESKIIDEYGKRYVIDFAFSHNERQAQIRSTWIVRTGEDFARLTSCYVL